LTVNANRHYWLHRINNAESLSHPLLFDHGLLSYGWGDVGVQKTPDDFRNGNGNNSDVEFNSAFETVYGDKFWPWRSRWFLWNFVCEMRAGDYVVVPATKVFSVFEVADDAPFSVRDFPDETLDQLKDGNGNAIVKNVDGLLRAQKDPDVKHADLGFFRRVKEVAINVPRGEYADGSLTSRLKYRGSNINCDTLQNSIEKAILGFRENKPINLHRLILDENRDDIVRAIRVNLNPYKFEKLVAWYLRKLGAKTDIPPKNQRDKWGDVDVVATFDALKILVFVQAKLHGENTDAWGAEQVEEYARHAADQQSPSEYSDEVNRGIVTIDGERYAILKWLVSAADGFTDDCESMAHECGIRLIDGKAFAKMLLEVGIFSLDEFDEA